jgi:ubiquinone/menaquinone biosynthesis C-methylase UbiE
MGLIGKIIYSSLSSKDKIEKYQQIIRDEEWKWLEQEIPKHSTFLDVGCGAGYAMQKAQEKLNCVCSGIDADPGAHGVGRFLKDMVRPVEIKQGYAENIPFADQSFQVVFSSHVLEHVNDESKSLQEMKRVLKNDGVLIIGMPTASMAMINLFSSLIFTTHIKVYELLRHLFTKESIYYFKNIFSVRSHSYPRANSIFYDLNHYRVANWRKIISSEFEIIKVLEPCLYPYPDYPQWFKIHESNWASSSVFFICQKKA